MALQWMQKGSLKGPKGDTGAQGPAGQPGASVRTASIDVTDNSDVSVDVISPSAGVRAGDLIIDATGALYAVASVAEGGGTVHVGTATSVSLMGPQGPKGDAGADGKDGTGVTILGSYDDAGALQDAHPTGQPGDAYLVAGDLYVWDATGSQWKNVGTIQGPQGPKGDAGEQGPKGDTGETGAQGPAGPGVTVGSGAPSSPGQAGAVYIDADTGTLYSYEDGQ